jgi:hypothetical protein
VPACVGVGEAGRDAAAGKAKQGRQGCEQSRRGVNFGVSLCRRLKGLGWVGALSVKTKRWACSTSCLLRVTPTKYPTDRR